MEASREFWDSFSSCGTIVADCSCGRVHFACNSDFDYEEGELEALLAKEKDDPDRYRGDHNNDAVSVMELPGGPVVWGCPCERAARHEQFLLDYQERILDFYRRVAAKRKRELKRLEQGLAAAKEVE